MKTLIMLMMLLNIYFVNNLNSKTLKIAVSNDLAPYTFLNKDNKIEGILIDYWLLWSKKTGIDVTFVISSWSETISAIKNKTVDIHSGLFFSKERNMNMVYLDKIYSSISNIYVRNNKNINLIKDLDGKIIAFLKGTYYENYIKNNYPKIKIKTYNNYQDLKKAFLKKEVDSFLDDSLIIWMNIIKTFSYNEIKTLDDFNLEEDFYAAVVKDDNELKKLVQNGIKLINNNDIKKIEEKWIINNDLRRYTKDNISITSLTKSQIEFLKNNKNLKIAIINHLKNFSSLDKNNKLVGFHVDLLNEINRILNSNLKFKIYDSWDKSFEDTKNAKVSGIFGLSWSRERDKYFNYSPSYYYSPFYLITREPDNSIKSLSDINNKIAVTIKNNISNTIIKNNNTNTKIIFVNKSEDKFTKIYSKDADFMLVQFLNKELLKKYNLKVSKIIYSKEGSFSFATAKENLIFSEIISFAIASLSKNFLYDLEKKWFDNEKKRSIFTKEEKKYIKYSPLIIVGVDNWKPVIFSKNNKSIDGIAGDILKRIEDISGLRFRAKTAEWYQLLEKFKKKEIDMLADTVLTKERLKYGLFTQSYLENQSTIFVKKNNTYVKSFKDLNYKNLGIQKGLSTINRIKYLYPKINIIETSSIKESLVLLKENKIDAIYAFELNVRYILDELFIDSLKTVYQNEIVDQKIRMFSQKDDLLLNSILNKSLYSISYQDRNEIISKWNNKEKHKNKLNIVLKSGKEPYVINKKFIKGIEYDLIELILSKSNISINSTIISKNIENFNIKDLDLDLDIKENYKSINQNNNLYYSDDLITFEDIIVSRKVDSFDINEISDLIDKRILSFKDSYKIYGDEFFKLFNPINRPNKYLEENSYENIVDSFLNNDTDLIIIPINIFKWYLKQKTIYSINDFNISFIFEKKESINLIFKEKRLRDLFNKNLKEIKSSGEYLNVFNKYVKADISSKIEVVTFLSSILGKFIFEENKKELKDILNIFSSLSFIEKIEVYSNKLLYSNTKKEYNNFIILDVKHKILNTNSKVGYLKVYFNNEKLLYALNNSKLIPELNLFDSFNSYSYLKSKYKEFKYLDKKIIFTKREKEFIKNNPIITFSEINWKPLSIIEDNKFNGLISDYLNIIEDKSTLHFKYIVSDSWIGVLEKLKNKEIYLVPGIDDNKEYKNIGLVSSQYTNFSFAVVTNSNGSFISDLNGLENKTVAMPKFYTSYNLIKDKFPKIKIIPTKTIKEALQLVALNKADAFVGHEAVAVYNIMNDFKDLKIVGVSKLKFKHHFLINKNHPALVSIVNKVFASITYQEKIKIRDRWLTTKINTAIDKSIIYQIIIAFIFILLPILYFMKKLSHTKKEVETEKKKFESLFADTADPVMLIKDGKYIDVNNSSLKLFEYKDKEEFLKLKAGTLAPEYQDNKQLSIEKMKGHLTHCLESGVERFQWKSKKSSSEVFWVEIVLTKLKFSGENIIHMLCRDISESKELELKIQEQKDIFESLFKGTSDGLTLMEDGKLIDCNYSLLKMFNIKNKEFLFNHEPGSLAPVTQPNGENSNDMFAKHLDLCKKNGYATFERLVLKTSGEEFWVNIILLRIKTKTKNLIYSIIRDISTRKILEEQVKERTNDLELSNNDLASSNNELQETILNLKETQNKLIESEKMASLGGLVAGVAHEINTPVGIGLTGISYLEELTIKINKEYVNDEISQETFEEYLNSSKDLTSLIQKNLERAASLVRSFKQVAVDQSSEEKRVFNLKDYLNEILQSIHSVTKKRNIKISISCDSDIKLNSYAGSYSQIITNLIMNSLIHGFKDDEKGNIFINVEKTANELKIIYKDTGCGISEKNLKKIFDPFFTTNRDNGGSGLGLNIIYNIIISTLGGSITCNSQENNGVEFIIILKV